MQVPLEIACHNIKSAKQGEREASGHPLKIHRTATMKSRGKRSSTFPSNRGL